MLRMAKQRALALRTEMWWVWALRTARRQLRWVWVQRTVKQRARALRMEMWPALALRTARRREWGMRTAMGWAWQKCSVARPVLLAAMPEWSGQLALWHLESRRAMAWGM